MIIILTSVGHSPAGVGCVFLRVVRYLEGDDLSSWCHPISLVIVLVVSGDDSLRTQQSREGVNRAKHWNKTIQSNHGGGR